MNFRLKRPCRNCPFLAKGAIELMPGRLEGIIDHLLESDHHMFQCHETTFSTGGEYVEDEDGNEFYKASGDESHCIGAAVYLLKAGHPNVAMRIGAAFNDLSFERLRKQYHQIIDPITVSVSRFRK